jgi:membrane protein DedA with SNARE-associated domain
MDEKWYCVEQFIEFVREWGYVAVFLGALVEGESVILTASSMAYFGYLNIYKIMIIAFFTTTIVDQLLFFVGRYYGESIFKRFPKLQGAKERAFRLLHKFDIWFILSFRFIYGIRTVSPIVVGAAKVTPARFIPLNIIAAFIWTVISCVGGYMLGEAMMAFLHNFVVIQRYIIGFLGIALLAFGGYHYWQKKKQAKL